MRLEKIRLSGFKSFVDPTMIPLPGNLVGIVGPNGCGKSNIIDAVRWVMGESSARHLRGESMSDVIFNGSSSRKPVGVASVELIFDNSDGSAPGEFAKFREISIKRQVSRDGVSVYFLNGSRCRRKDITDIFLGTGLGARSYAIIEQGTISRLIEAKPEELRAVIEEAAGISKYKERRHETEIRMQHTRENLERLQDLRDEVAKQLGNLQRQAKKAEKYTALKEEERLYRRQLLGIRWRKYDQLLHRHRSELLECEGQFRDLTSDANNLTELEEAAREKREKLQRSANERQGRFYELGAEISRLDQAIKHAQQTRDGLNREHERLSRERLQNQLQLEQDREQIDVVQEELLDLESRILDAQQGETQAAAVRSEAHLALKAWRARWDGFKGEMARYQGQVDVERARIRQMDDRQRQLENRRERLRAEQLEVENGLVDSELHVLQESLAMAESDQARIQSRLEELQSLARDERTRGKACQEALNMARAELHTVAGKISSLDLLQQHAMGKDRANLTQWLQQANLDGARRLAEHLDVSPGWESAVESVLGVHLESVCVENAGRYLPLLESGEHPDSVAFFETRNPASKHDLEDGERLLDCIESDWNLNSLLGGVHRAAGLAEARRLCERLADHESVVTPKGVWMGPGWLVMVKPGDGKAGMLARERELRQLRHDRDEMNQRVGRLEQNLNQADERARLAEFEQQQRQSESSRLLAEISGIKARISAENARAEQSRKRLRQLEQDLEELEQHLRENAEESAEAGAVIEEAEAALAELERQAHELGGRQEELEQREGEAETGLRHARERLHSLRSRADTLRSTEALTLKHLERAQQQFGQTGDRLEELARRLNEANAPMEEERKTLDELLRQRTAVERELADLRKKTNEAEAEIRSVNENRMRKEQALEALKKRLEQIKLDYQGNDVRQQAMQEQFEEIGANPAVVIPDLPDDADEREWQLKVTRLAEEIARLGAINLTAMEEYNQQSERLKVLDEQRQDLSESLATLTQAIEKIDRECRARFKETFERINDGIQRMFPKLFGGGQAYLKMPERDLLETGVSIMARPPGKRNSSIHLLSGGEKALTAVALVFSIFELNPAPFCLLDEVDAPLDDANVGRFGQLVKEMAEKVQFLFISHNKATMEIAQHLAGVTMKEPGVSRIVAVDIDEAVELAAQ